MIDARFISRMIEHAGRLLADRQITVEVYAQILLDMSDLLVRETAVYKLNRAVLDARAARKSG